MFTDEDQTYVSEQIVIRLGLGNYLNQYHTTRISIPCIFHNDKTPSMSIYLNTGTYKCYGCGEYGSLRKLYRDRFGHSINKDLDIEYVPRKKTIFELFDRTPPINLNDTPKTSIALSGEFIPASMSVIAQKYLKKRGISLQVAESMKMSVGKNAFSYNKNDAHNKEYFINFSNRLCIPIFENKSLLSCEGRDMYGEQFWEEQAKLKGIDNFIYKKCVYPKLSSTNTLYQLQKLDANKKIYFVEGLMDLAVLRSSNFFNEKNSTSIFGSCITNRQYFLLCKFKEICYIIDNDLAGWLSLKALYNHIDSLQFFPYRYNYTFLVPPLQEKGVKDIGDIPQKTSLTIDDCIKNKWLLKEQVLIDSGYKIDKMVEYFIQLKNKKRS